jgi:nucleoside-diphosphate-sugar epimerase
LRATARQVRPDVVVDMIALTEAHARATLDLSRGGADRVVAISSMDVYRAFEVFDDPARGPLAPVPIREDDELRSTPSSSPRRDDAPPANRPPDYDKTAVERVLRQQSDVAWTLLRLSIVFGPGDAARRRTRPYVKRMSDARPAILMSHGLSRWVISRAYVENAAAAIAEAIVSDRAANRIYNVADAPALSELQWVQTLADAAGWRGRIVTVPDQRLPPELQPRGNFAQHLTLDTSRIREELGYREGVPLAEAVRRTVAWELANPPADVPVEAFPYSAEDAVLASERRAERAAGC